MESAVCNSTAQGAQHQGKGLPHVHLAVICEGLMAVAASASSCQFAFGCKSFDQMEGHHVTSATQGSSHSGQPQQGIGDRRQNLAPSLVRQPSSGALETSEQGFSGVFKFLSYVQAHFYRLKLSCRAQQQTSFADLLDMSYSHPCYEIQLF